MVLGRSRIEELVGKGLIEGFSEASLGGSGYDLRLGRVYRLKSDSFLGVEGRKTPEVGELEGDRFVLKPGEYVLVETLEKVNMPVDVCARVLNRSTIFRCGCSLFNALVDPGFRGTLTFGLKNLSDREFTVERGARIAQIVFEEVEGETVEYEGKYQGGKVV
ncbi:MAG: dCTP deaminase [Candidatus Altiarchaeales archaeon]|nr:dCTP deaminase [Candidatus Altiarchaeales archaeon]MBD3415879.1 dCTP deaminase [Candidatus Altiarchaeales archaeon]